jgi:hypothetical protein
MPSLVWRTILVEFIPVYSMLRFCSNSFMLSLKIIAIVCLGRMSGGIAIVLWQQLIFPSGLLRFCRTCNTVPYLLLELRLRLNLRYWMIRLSRAMIRSTCCQSLFSASARHGYLHYRDGRRAFDFFKTLSLTDVSPPLPA